jgi:hypothetical protein
MLEFVMCSLFERYEVIVQGKGVEAVDLLRFVRV